MVLISCTYLKSTATNFRKPASSSDANLHMSLWLALIPSTISSASPISVDPSPTICMTHSSLLVLEQMVLGHTFPLIPLIPLIAFSSRKECILKWFSFRKMLKEELICCKVGLSIPKERIRSAFDDMPASFVMFAPNSPHPAALAPLCGQPKNTTPYVEVKMDCKC